MDRAHSFSLLFVGRIFAKPTECKRMLMTTEVFQRPNELCKLTKVVFNHSRFFSNHSHYCISCCPSNKRMFGSFFSFSAPFFVSNSQFFVVLVFLLPLWPPHPSSFFVSFFPPPAFYVHSAAVGYVNNLFCYPFT